YQVFWFFRGKSELEPLEPGADGLFRSAVFPGLWLDPKALGEGNLAALRAAVDEGLSTPDHQAFAARLRQAGPR
ncbi:MAG: hypothetical protein WD278_00850, partial [Pirellulales bacterium]